MATRRVELGPVGEHVRQSVRAIRRSKDWRLEDLAENLREGHRPLSKAVLSQIETGGRRVDVDDLVALAHALGVSIDDILPDDETPPMEPLEAIALLKRAELGLAVNQRLYERAIQLITDAAEGQWEQ